MRKASGGSEMCIVRSTAPRKPGQHAPDQQFSHMCHLPWRSSPFGAFFVVPRGFTLIRFRQNSRRGVVTRESDSDPRTADLSPCRM